MEDRISIVVLNYLNYNDTIECVNSLLDIDYDNYEIVVVDNGSTNESYEILKKKFNQLDSVHLINTGENLGYARGNNFGIDYSRKELSTDHVLVINNDTIVEDKDILNVFLESKNEGLILGPKIINLNNINQNPAKIYSMNLNKIIKKLIVYILYFLKIKKSFFKVYHLFKKPSSDKKSLKEKNKDKIVLHGSCLFFTKEFFNYYKGYFNKTFLYYEEDIIYILVKKINGRLKYIEDTYIIHKEDCSSEMAFDNKKRIKKKHEFKSFIWFLLLLLMPYSLIKKIFSI